MTRMSCIYIGVFSGIWKKIWTGQSESWLFQQQKIALGKFFMSKITQNMMHEETSFFHQRAVKVYNQLFWYPNPQAPPFPMYQL